MSVLLLDEMLSPGIAEQLSRAGCDATATSARADLRGMPDADLLEFAAREKRILVTDNIRDFVPLSHAWTGLGRTHPGIILISSKTFPMTRGRSALITRALLERCAQQDWPGLSQFDFL